ncbi:MAG: tyrosine-type recombinase/integrase, partial [Eikenella corrodens]|uniref:tyrosine-type recombinase/integrase n=1 Tax=Eikenella corrodens TaxID=539 RepID=UPI003609432A
MRASEVLAVREETLYENYIDIIDQVYNGQYVPLKTKEARKIPICTELYDLIINNFPNMTYPQLSCEFRKVIEAAGLAGEKKKRGLCFHSFRHTFNTYLLAENVPPHKVAAVMGHSSGIGSMQERYTNWRAEMMPEIYAAQEKLL